MTIVTLEKKLYSFLNINRMNHAEHLKCVGLRAPKIDGADELRMNF